jgi:4'-phosphopantetheinyl transferase
MIRWILARPGPGLDHKRLMNPSELEEGKRYRHAGRYRQWLLGRSAAKTLMEKQVRLPARQIHVRRTGDGWPQPLTPEGIPLPVSLSISHTGERALCAVCPDGEGIVGADIEVVAEKPQPMLEDFYTDEERLALACLDVDEQARVATVYWCIKEAVLKARRTGLSEDAKAVSVRSLGKPAPNGGWSRAEVELRSLAARPEVFWRVVVDGLLAMAIARLPSEQPPVSSVKSGA